MTAFFKKAMKKFGISSPADLKSEEDKKEFFNYVDKNFKGKNEEVNEEDGTKTMMMMMMMMTMMMMTKEMTSNVTDYRSQR